MPSVPNHVRPALSCVLAIASAAVGWQLAPASAQSADEAAQAAETVAARAQGVMERIDPTTLGPSLVLNPSLSDPYAAPQIAVAGMPALIDAAPTAAPTAAQPVAPVVALPPAALMFDDEVSYSSAPRGPAVRMIAREVVQPLPAPPAPSAAQRARAAGKKDRFVVKSILPIEGTIRYGDWFWDESNAPATGTLVITIDLEARVISAFRDGHEIGTAVALLGTTDHPTPLGAFPVLNKNREYYSKKYNRAPMPFSLWITNTGIAIHGSPVTNGYASHGCIGVPDPFAEKLFAATKRGDKVIITRGKIIGIGDQVI
jgi:lipoprotein-anchoring transpeptidase ErfK/SrfK